MNKYMNKHLKVCKSYIEPSKINQLSKPDKIIFNDNIKANIRKYIKNLNIVNGNINKKIFLDIYKIIFSINENKNWKLSFEELKDMIKDETKAIIINTPNNPTGSNFSKRLNMGLVNLL